MSDRPIRGLPADAVLVPAERVKPKPARAAFAPPPVPAHRIVAWYAAHDDSGEPTAAIVRQVNGETLNLAVFTKDGIRYVNGCRHVTDPRSVVVGTNHPNRQGVWTLMPDDSGAKVAELHVRLLDAVERIQSLEETVAGILGGSLEEYRSITGQVGPVDPPVIQTSTKSKADKGEKSKLGRVDGHLDGLLAEIDGEGEVGFEETDDDDRS